MGGKGDLSKRFGNPTPLYVWSPLSGGNALIPQIFSGIAGFLLSLTPLSIYLMNFGQSGFVPIHSHAHCADHNILRLLATGTSATAIIGAFYALGGVCMILAGLLGTLPASEYDP